MNPLFRFFITAFEAFALFTLLLGNVWFGFNFADPNGLLLIAVGIALTAWIFPPKEMSIICGVAAVLALAASTWKIATVVRSGDDIPALVILLFITAVVVTHFLLGTR